MRFRINFFYQVAVMMLSIILITCCNNVPDYREDFIGQYRCHYTAAVWLYEDGEYFLHTYQYKSDTIFTVSNGEEFDQIEFFEKIWVINEDGESDYYGCVDSGDYCDDLVESYLDFVGDSISFFARSGHGANEYKVNGIKISNYEKSIANESIYKTYCVCFSTRYVSFPLVDRARRLMVGGVVPRYGGGVFETVYKANRAISA